jgi:hypothetical protein
MKDRKHIIYAFIDGDKKPFYIGRTYNLTKRKKEHLYEVSKGNTLPKYNKLRKLLNMNFNFDDLVYIIESNIDSDLIEQSEVFYIAKLRQEGYNLKNLTDGGEGSINTIPGLSDKLKLIHTGSKRSEETKKRMSDARKGIKFSDEHKKNLSTSRKKRITTIETREKCSKTSKGKINIKKYILIDPQGKEYITENGLTLFCQERGLKHTNFFKVLKGERSHVSGWKIKAL